MNDIVQEIIDTVRDRDSMDVAVSCLSQKAHETETHRIIAGLIVANNRRWTDEDMAEAHRSGWRCAYYHGTKQHQSSEEWVEQYKEKRKK